MRRSAFTIIELIFVIFILGVLAAVAVVKMGGMSDRAQEIQLKAFAGTLNRTSGAGFWFRSMEDGLDGNISNPAYDLILEQYIEIVPGYSTRPSLVNCNSAGNGVFLTYPFTVTYEIHCKNGTPFASPKFRLYNVDESIYID
ncbi:MAG: type II secretion system protein [Helicobacteraceae bacterium]|jgi:prepilin-type N-terminal cleavage/methylation domain-containing protein|nr:type II secretion system protein [Helicobacteraceae bacterium]